MSNREGEGIRNVWRLRGCQPESDPDHMLHLLLGRPPVSDDGLFHRRRCVALHRHACFRGCKADNPARVSDPEGRAGKLAMAENLFQSDCVWLMLHQDGRKSVVHGGQPGLQRNRSATGFD